VIQTGEVSGGGLTDEDFRNAARLGKGKYGGLALN
jgi:hypothetical protein